MGRREKREQDRVPRRKKFNPRGPIHGGFPEGVVRGQIGLASGSGARPGARRRKFKPREAVHSGFPDGVERQLALSRTPAVRRRRLKRVPPPEPFHSWYHPQDPDGPDRAVLSHLPRFHRGPTGWVHRRRRAALKDKEAFED